MTFERRFAVCKLYSLLVGVRELHAEAVLREERVTSQRYLYVAGMRYGTSQQHQRGSSVTFVLFIFVAFLFRVLVRLVRSTRRWIADVRQPTGTMNHLKTQNEKHVA